MISRVLFLTAFAVAFAACGGGGQGFSPADAGSGPAATGAQASGPRVVEVTQAQSQVNGKPVAYFFTAPGCSSCVPDVQALQSAAQNRPSVQLVGVDVASQDSPGDFADWLRAQNLTSTRFIWTIDTGNNLVRRFGVSGLGTTVLVDSSGKVRFVNQGTRDSHALEQQLGQLS